MIEVVMKPSWPVLVSVALAVVLVSTSRTSADQPQKKPAGSTLRIVKDDLVEVDVPVRFAYIVKGSIYNPNNEAVKNVVIRYYIWKKWMGKDDPQNQYGSIIRETGGLVSATIKYLPPKQIVEFTASGSAFRRKELPDPINAEITAERDDQ